MKPTKANVEKMAASLRAVVRVKIDTREIKDMAIEAPKGHIWEGSRTHEMVFNDSDFGKWSDLYADALDRMQYGLVPCDDLDCEWCLEEPAEVK